MKAREILLGGLTVLASAGVIRDYVLKREIVNRPVVRAYVGLQDQIDYLDKRIQNEELDDYSIGRLEDTRNSIIETKLKFYVDNNSELRSAEKEIDELDYRQWILLGIASLSMSGFVLSRRLFR